MDRKFAAGDPDETHVVILFWFRWPAEYNVKDLERNTVYDFQNQKVLPFNQVMVMNKHDIIVTHCVWNLPPLNTVTIGG